MAIAEWAKKIPVFRPGLDVFSTSNAGEGAIRLLGFLHINGIRTFTSFGNLVSHDVILANLVD